MQVDSVPVHLDQVVGASQLVGRIGDTGESFGAHLHLEMWSDGNRTHFNPFNHIHWADLAQPGVAITEEVLMHPSGVVYRITNPQGGMNGACVIFGASRIAVPANNDLALALAGLLNRGVTNLPNNNGDGQPVTISQDNAEYLAQTYAPAGTLGTLVWNAGQTGLTQHWPA